VRTDDVRASGRDGPSLGVGTHTQDRPLRSHRSSPLGVAHGVRRFSVHRMRPRVPSHRFRDLHRPCRQAPNSLCSETSAQLSTCRTSVDRRPATPDHFVLRSLRAAVSNRPARLAACPRLSRFASRSRPPLWQGLEVKNKIARGPGACLQSIPPLRSAYAEDCPGFEVVYYPAVSRRERSEGQTNSMAGAAYVDAAPSILSTITNGQRAVGPVGTSAGFYSWRSPARLTPSKARSKVRLQTKSGPQASRLGAGRHSRGPTLLLGYVSSRTVADATDSASIRSRKGERTVTSVWLDSITPPDYGPS